MFTIVGLVGCDYYGTRVEEYGSGLDGVVDRAQDVPVSALV